jgi:cyclic-di-GMP-binding protein
MPSFDIASKPNWAEIDNALNQAQKELSQRFDFKGTESEVEKTKEGLQLTSASEDRLLAALDVLHEKLIRRKVSLRFLDAEDPKPTSKGGAKMLIKVKDGIETDDAKKIVAAIKDAKLKVQGAITDAQVRVSGKNKDDLQKAIQAIKQMDFGIELSFLNFRD